MQPEVDELFEAVVSGSRDRVEASVHRALETGIPAETLLGEGLVRAMDEVGRRFEICEFYVPEMLTSARAMTAASFS